MLTHAHTHSHSNFSAAGPGLELIKRSMASGASLFGPEINDTRAGGMDFRAKGYPGGPALGQNQLLKVIRADGGLARRQPWRHVGPSEGRECERRRSSERRGWPPTQRNFSLQNLEQNETDANQHATRTSVLSCDTVKS